MKALQVSAFSLPETVGGTQVMLAALCRSLQARGHAATVFRAAPGASVAHLQVGRSDFEGTEVVSVGNDFSDLETFERLYRDERIDALFEQELLRTAPDVAHVHHVTCLSTGVLDVLRRHRVPTVLSLWDYWLGCPRGQRIQDDLRLCTEVDRATCARCCARLWPQLFRGDDTDVETMRRYDDWIRRQLDEVDVLAVPSQHTRDEYRRAGLRRAEIDVVPCGLDVARFDATPRTAGPRLRVAYIGSVIPSKGAHVLIDAVQRLAPDSVELEVFGEPFAWHGDAGYEQRLRALDRGTHRITLHGRYDPNDVQHLLTDIDVLVMPGLWFETFCLTIREGFLSGVAVVASRLGAMAEAIEDGVTGLLVEPDDPEDLARALRRLQDDSALRQQLAAAKKPVDDTDTMVARFLALYDRALGALGREARFS